MSYSVLGLMLAASLALGAGSEDAASPAASRAQVLLPGSGPSGIDAVPWQTKAICPMISERPGGCGDGNYFYIMGGHDENNTVRSSVYRYNPGTDVWDSVAPMAEAADNIGVCYSPHWNRIFVVGNYSPQSNRLQVYDVAGDSWYIGANAPYVDYGAAAAALGPHVYVLWGSGNNGRFWSYHPDGDSWHQLADCPGATSHAGLCALGGHIYASGGWSSNAMFQRYDPGTNAWTALASLPQGRHGHGMDAFDGRIYVYAGGQSWFTPTPNCYCYHPAADSWSLEGSMVYSHIAGGFGGVPYGGDFLLHAAAGYNGSTRINDHEQGTVEGGGVSPDSLYFKAYMGTHLMVAPKVTSPTPANRTPMSFQNSQSVPCMEPRGRYVYEVYDGNLRRFSTEDGSQTDFGLGRPTGHVCGTDGNFIYVPVYQTPQVDKYTMTGVYVNTTNIDTVCDNFSFAVVNDTVWVSPDRYGEVFCGYASSKFNGGSITRDAVWAVGPGVNGTGNLAWDDANYFLPWIGTTNITFKTFDQTRSLADSGTVSIDPRSVMCRCVPRPEWLDVGVTHLLAPTGTVDSGTVVTPACSVGCFSSLPIPNYNVRMRIGTGYNQVAPVNNHLPGTRRYVAFPNWVAHPVGMIAVTCSTELGPDMCPGNDARHDSVQVDPVVGVEEETARRWVGFCEISPNPGPGRVLVDFGLPKPGFFSLRLYDAAGRMVAVLAQGQALPEMARVEVVRDRLGIAAGVYLVVLEGTDYRTTGKLLLE